MGKPKCKYGGKCPYQKYSFYEYGFDYGDSCPHLKYKNSNRTEENNGEPIRVLDDKCINLVFPQRSRKCGLLTTSETG